MANPREPHGDGERGLVPRTAARESEPGGAGHAYAQSPRPRAGARREDGADLKALVSRLGQDVSQLAHDEMTLAKLELRSLADALSSDVQSAARTMVKDLAKVGVALSLAVLAGLALTAGAILGIGVLVGAYWAGGLIVGLLYLVAAVIFGMSAAKDLKESDSLRLEATRQRAEQNRDVLAREAEETGRFAREEAQEFKRNASPGGTRTQPRH